MKSLLDFALSMLVGLLLHQTASITHKMPPEQLSGTTVGVLGTLPLFSLWLRRLDGIKNPYTRATSAYLLAFLGVGSGVALGWLVDTLFGIDRGME